MTMTYREQLLHPNWQKKRLHMLEKAGWVCLNCMSGETTLHVHHKKYIKGRKAWEYEDDELNVLCADCHEQEHADRALLDRLLAESDIGGASLQVAIGLIAGYLEGQLGIEQDLAEAAIKIDGHSFDLGMLASIACGTEWPRMFAAAEALGQKLTPPQENAVHRWKGAIA